MRCSGALALASVLASGLCAQQNWIRRIVPGPQPRQRAGMVFDSQRGVTVLFGGNNGGTTSFNDTWEWDGSAWTQRFPAVSPPSSRLLAYDSARGVAVLVASNGTWEWDGVAWTLRSTQPVSGNHIAHDPARARTVLLGSDTKEWDGVTWTTLPTAPTAAHLVMSMGYDPASQRVTAFTPFQGVSNPTAGGRLWSWDGAVWTSTAPVPGPYLRGGTFVTHAGSLRMYGGDDGYSAIVGLYSPMSVNPMVTSSNPGGRWGQSMAYDSLRGRLVLFGGYWLHPTLLSQALRGDTWEFVVGTLPAQSQPYGSGCGAPPLSLAAAPLSRPLPNTTFVADIGNATPFATGMAWGVSSQIYFSAGQLPIDMAPWGMPGCPLQTSADGVLPCTTAGGNVQFQLAVPNTAALFGVAIYLQAFSYRQGLNQQQIGVSNGLQVLVGNL